MSKKEVEVLTRCDVSDAQETRTLLFIQNKKSGNNSNKRGFVLQYVGNIVSQKQRERH